MFSLFIYFRLVPREYVQVSYRSVTSTLKFHVPHFVHHLQQWHFNIIKQNLQTVMHKSLVHDGLKVANVFVMFSEQQVVHKMVYAIVVDIAKMAIFGFLRVSRALSFFCVCTEIIPQNSVIRILISI